MITAQPERLADCLEEWKRLTPGHYAALSLHKGRFPLAPQYAVYLDRERRGEMVFMALRCQGALVGYWITFVAPGLHYETCLTGIMDIWWIEPEHMAGAAPLILGRAVEREMVRRGVKLWFAGEKLHKPCGRLYTALGMEPVETFYSKWL